MARCTSRSARSWTSPARATRSKRTISARGRIRVTARLVRVADGTQLWTSQFDDELRDILALQDSISERVTRELALQLSDAEKERLTKKFFDTIGPFIGVNKDIPAPDVNTGAREMAWALDRLRKQLGYWEHGIVTGKPLELGPEHGHLQEPALEILRQCAGHLALPGGPIPCHR